MWLRTALLLVLGLLAYRFLNGLLRSLGRPSRPGARPGGEQTPPGAPPGTRPADATRSWPPGEVIDVPYRDVPRDSASAR